MKSAKHIASALLLLTITAALLYLCNIGYGDGHTAIQKQKNISRYTSQPKPSQLFITYERCYQNNTDFLQLKIDTTYHKIGKSGYVYELICNRELTISQPKSLRDIPSYEATECFITGGSRKWYINNIKRDILGHQCQYAGAIDGNSTWESWYCDALPYVDAKARTTDGLSGLILEARNIEKQYTLKAINISKTI